MGCVSESGAYLPMTQLERAGHGVLAKVLGVGRAERIADVYRDRILPAAESLTYAISARGQASRKRLADLSGRYAGERCFIIGNGPSITRTDLSRLRDEYTFALNRGYLLFDRLGGPASFLVAMNRHVVHQFGAELVAAGSPLFVGWRSRGAVPSAEHVTFIRRAPRFTFSADVARDGASEGPTVTFMAMQLAYHMGFSEVVLVGIDHSFSTTGRANDLVKSSGADPNHFDPNYFGAGVRWQLPDLAMSEVVYRIAKQRFEEDGRRILDATVGGRLGVYPKVDLEDLEKPAWAPD